MSRSAGLGLPHGKLGMSKTESDGVAVQGCLVLAYIFDVVIGNETSWFLVLVGAGPLLGLPPIILGALLENVDKVSFLKS